ncbi:MAG: PstS family phosphate ABC transporter substrate-binding protein [Phormidium tanganyikae FI6-MK23]|jgi:phosphate transport system substrate-binding protein|nr:PstS family phosphate ABC transporter substrate-binding protein [Phormidium tanganyikae FI6-MK23]
MTQKNETPALIVSLLVTGCLLGAGAWWITKGSRIDLSQTNLPASPQSSVSSTQVNWSSVQNVPSGIFNYGGSTSWAPLRLSVDSTLQAARPEFRLRYVDPAGSTASSTSGIRMLLDGQIQFAQSSRPVSPQEQQEAQQKGFSLREIPIAIDGLAIAVNSSLNLPGLSLGQLRDIYTGQVTNWKQVGGSDLPITAFSRDSKSGGTVELFIEQVLNKQALGSSVQIVSTTTEALRKLGATPGGIYFASAPEVVPQCTVKSIPIARTNQFVAPYQEPIATCPTRNQLNTKAFQDGTYPLTRNLSVIVKQNNGTEQKAGEAYANLLLSTPAQEAISKAGFVRIR